MCRLRIFLICSVEWLLPNGITPGLSVKYVDQERMTLRGWGGKECLPLRLSIVLDAGLPTKYFN